MANWSSALRGPEGRLVKDQMPELEPGCDTMVNGKGRKEQFEGVRREPEPEMRVEVGAASSPQCSSFPELGAELLAIVFRRQVPTRCDGSYRHYIQGVASEIDCKKTGRHTTLVSSETEATRRCSHIPLIPLLPLLVRISFPLVLEQSPFCDRPASHLAVVHLAAARAGQG